MADPPRHHHRDVTGGLTEVYVRRGVDAQLAAQVAQQLSRDPDQALVIHADEELGVDPRLLPNPLVAAAVTYGVGLAFHAGVS